MKASLFLASSLLLIVISFAPWLWYGPVIFLQVFFSGFTCAKQTEQTHQEGQQMLTLSVAPQM